MKIEREVTILDIDKEKFVELILKLGAEKVSDELTQIRYTYDFVPAQANKWIRLRTNGQKSTLTIKEVFDKNAIGGTKEWEIEVSDFEETNKILNELGYFYRNKQENKRQVFMLDGVEISVDTWPKIPPYAEFEGQTEKDVKNLLKKLNIPPEKITTLDVSSIYKEIYGIDILKIKDLTF
jgi:adenylate cyclase class 2